MLNSPLAALIFFSLALCASATPANRAALDRHYDRFLAKNLNRCTTCHLPSALHTPETLAEFPHNPFGDRLRRIGEDLAANGPKQDLPTRLARAADEDADGDGVPNQTEILLGHNPGDAMDKPGPSELKEASRRRAEFQEFLASYRWQPFETINRPAVPTIQNSRWIRNPIDAFIAAEHQQRHLQPRPEASKVILLRRVYLDLIGLSPTPDEQNDFLADTSPLAFEQVVDRLLNDPRHGERWGRHWMDVWRYSDWAGWSGGNQIRDSKPHIWRWRDWIVESLNADKGYNQMLTEMLAADELWPGDTNALRATGFLVRNYKMLSREQWLEDTIKHTSQAFLGVTVGCAKCHDHMVDPISQGEYYSLRAIFEPHHVRTDRVPGETDLLKDGVVYAYDKETNALTYFLVRGDERKPDTNRVMAPAVPKVLGGHLEIAPTKLPPVAAFPDKREFVIRDLITASEKSVNDALEKLDKAHADQVGKPEQIAELEVAANIARARHASLLAVVKAEKLEDAGAKGSDSWKEAARDAVTAQRKLAVLEAGQKLQQAETARGKAQTKADDAHKALAALASAQAAAGHEPAPASEAEKKKAAVEKADKELEGARKKLDEAETALAGAKKEEEAPVTEAYKPRQAETYPETSTGRRSAFARWLANEGNPLTARVAVNHIWLRHFGRGIVPTPADFGRNGKPPSHPQLLDWLASELMTPSVDATRGSSVVAADASTLQRFNEVATHSWSMKHIHRLIVTSRTYRMASTPDEADARIDPDNVYLWRMPSRRMEAELVRDNLLYVSGDLDQTMGGPDIDNNQGMTSRRRSLYLRQAAEKEVEFLKIFDGPNVTECYARRPTVVPQQALALANSELALRQARSLAARLSAECGADDAAFVRAAFPRVLNRKALDEELRLCLQFLQGQPDRKAASEAQVIPASVQGKSDAGEHPPVARPRENLVLVLLNHNDFVTVR